jgi:hypothetical protein
MAWRTMSLYDPGEFMVHLQGLSAAGLMRGRATDFHGQDTEKMEGRIANGESFDSASFRRWRLSQSELTLDIQDLPCRAN